MTSIELMSRLEYRRRELGMTKRELAKRTRIPIASLNRILLGQEKRVGFERVAALAGTLGVVIHVGSTTTIDEPETAYDLRRKQARRKAEKVAKLVQGTMGLESQAVGPRVLNEIVEQTTDQLVTGSSRKLWSA